MATSKSKKTAAKNKASSAKAKTGAKATKVTKKASVTGKGVVGKKTTTKSAKNNSKEIVAKQPIASDGKKSSFKNFFAKKYNTNESILTIFKKKNTYGALLGELIGTMLITTIFIAMLQLNEPLWMLFSILPVILAVYKLSGSNLNPAITVGMMITRRISVIRGVLYIVAQILGAWIGMLIMAKFCDAGGMGSELPKMAAIEDGQFWMVTMIEFFGASIIGFCFARALQYKHSSFTFAIVVAGGIITALILALVISILYASLSSNFVLNPAIAFMYKILPTAGTEFSEVLGSIAVALTAYVIFPSLGCTIGFLLSDVSSFLSDESVN
ncbi:aquaporin [Candidatus Saccharibacteria bacterium]|nr:aquaporin [Candidatus Saccharibacteria bacterium]